MVITASDCTGHGVPGAFMSMLGVSFLNVIVRRKDVVNTAQILNQLRSAVIDALKQTGEYGSQKDGMDMSIIAIHKNRQKAMWSGANNPLWIIRKEKQSDHFDKPDELPEEIKGDSMPVAIHIRMDDFTNHEFTLNPGDLYYLFTDGYPDQFGGPRGKKFKHKQLKELLIDIQELSMTEQKRVLETKLDDWMYYDGKAFEQIDEITIVGLRV